MFKEIDLDTDIEDDGYFNNLVDEDNKFKAACDLVDYLTVDDSNSIFTVQPDKKLLFILENKEYQWPQNWPNFKRVL